MSQGDELTRDNVTAASRVMLPTYAAFFSIVGLSFMLTPTQRLIESPALAYAGDLLPLRAWGVMFMLTALGMVGALCIHQRTAYRFALWVGIVLMGGWTGTLAAAAILGAASPSAWSWPAVVAAACFATDRSLRRGEI